MSRQDSAGEVIRDSGYARVTRWKRSDVIRLYKCPWCGTDLGDPTSTDGDVEAVSAHYLMRHKPSDLGLSPLHDGRNPYGDRGDALAQGGVAHDGGDGRFVSIADGGATEAKFQSNTEAGE